MTLVCEPCMAGEGRRASTYGLCAMAMVSTAQAPGEGTSPAAVVAFSSHSDAAFSGEWQQITVT